MKMVMSIVNHDDAPTVTHNLTKEGFQVTKLATTGGFLKAGNTTILVGVDDEKVETVINLIKKYSRSRSQVLPTAEIGSGGVYSSMPIEVMVGGATCFVLNVERFEKV